MVKPFRFGVQCGGDRDRADFEQLARKIEALGYATLYLPAGQYGVRALVRTTGTPPLGPTVAARVAVRAGCFEASVTSKPSSSVPSTIFISWSAKAAPRQRRAPPPNGRYSLGAKLGSPRKRSGRKRAGSG